MGFGSLPAMKLFASVPSEHKATEIQERCVGVAMLTHLVQTAIDRNPELDWRGESAARDVLDEIRRPTGDRRFRHFRALTLNVNLVNCMMREGATRGPEGFDQYWSALKALIPLAGCSNMISYFPNMLFEVLRYEKLYSDRMQVKNMFLNVYLFLHYMLHILWSCMSLLVLVFPSF